MSIKFLVKSLKLRDKKSKLKNEIINPFLPKRKSIVLDDGKTIEGFVK